MADWEDEGFEPGEIDAKKGDEWEGEDEDDDSLKENWDDDEEEKDKPAENQTETQAVVVKKKKSTVKQKILEKEEQRKEEMLRKAKLREEQGDDDEDDEESIFALELAEKQRKQKLVEEADLQVAKDLFGGEVTNKSIDNFKPTNHDEFMELAKMITDKLSQFETSVEYPAFLEVLVRDLASGVGKEQVKKLVNALSALAKEKQNAEKPIKAGKKHKRAVLGGGAKGTKGVDTEDYSLFQNDDMDGFM